MAHIVSCMLEGEPEAGTSNLYISKPSSPPPSDDQTSSDRPGEKPYVWRMHQPERKYQLFPPKDKQPAPAPSKGLDPEQAFALAMGQNGEKTDKPSTSGGLRLRIKEHTLIRRRKVSVPDLGPMTTVQEVAMDSPTIPGRPPLHERSISAPGHSWRYQPFPDAPVSRPSVHDELDEIISEAVACTVDRSSAKQPLSPKSLAPLVIPPHVSAAPRLAHQSSLGRLRSTSSSTDPLRSARPDDSPKTKTPFTPFTPLSANTAMTTPRSAMTTSTLPTPLSAPVEARSSPKPWPETDVALLSTPKKDSSPDPNATPKAEVESRSAAPMLGHRRGQSENSTMGIMERGRPRKRVDNGETVAVRAASKRSKSAERRAFESLPKGWKASEASTVLTQNEVSSIQRQALQQAARFEVLRREDVDNLSKELRHLDERTEYLRRTYTSLRAGRRNLHSRICQYLRSPRVAKFSHESMLKQEESLAELDASIDDWVTKLDHAENRRTRVRQKLLEHVAAAAMLASPGIVGASESLQYAMGVKATQLPNGTGNIATPPRSPTKLTFLSSAGSPSPQRVGAHVPSTIFEQPLFEDAATVDLAPVPPTAATRNSIAASRVDVESIRIYAGDELYTLLTDVENEISRMGEASSLPAAADSPNLTDEERKHLHRAHSQELLNGGALAKKCSPPPSPERSPVRKNSVGEVLLTNAVFRPERSVLAL